MDTPFPDELVVDSDADLTALWRVVLGDLPIDDRTLWMLVLDADGQVGGPLLEVTDLPDGPYDVPVEDLAGFVDDILQAAPGASVAMLMARPGEGPWHVGDRAWTRYLLDAAAGLGSRVWPVHRACAGRLELCRP